MIQQHSLPRIGFVGVGRMGANMARRLKDCRYPVTAVYDIDGEAARLLAEEIGADDCQTLEAVTRQADVIFTVVSDDKAMAQIYRQPGDNLFQNASGKLFINCATVSPSIHRALYQEAKSSGAEILETPMASSIPQARNGTLFLMCAGDPAVFEKARPLLEDMSESLVFTGAPGTAASLKAIVNMVMNINTAALAEGLGLADALGLDLRMVREVFSKTGANSRVLETDGEDMQMREHSPYFSAAHAAKDSGIALMLGKSQELPMILAEAAKHQFDEMVRLGLGGLDKSGISELTFKRRHPQHQDSKNKETVRK